MTTSRRQIIAALANHQDRVATLFGVRRLALLGSAVRDELNKASDVDILVEFAGREDFERNRLVYDATLRNLELLGEAARDILYEKVVTICHMTI